MTVIPCFWNSAIVWSRKRACSTSAELPARTVYVRSSKQRDSAAVFLVSTPGPHGGVAARTGNARRGDGTSCDDGAAVEPSMAMVRYMSRVFIASPGVCLAFPRAALALRLNAAVAHGVAILCAIDLATRIESSRIPTTWLWRCSPLNHQ